MVTTSVVYDVAVIGAGVTGSATAYQIAKSGAKVVLLEQVASWTEWKNLTEPFRYKLRNGTFSCAFDSLFRTFCYIRDLQPKLNFWNSLWLTSW